MVTYRRTFTHIIHDPEILGSEPVVARTRLSVRAVVITNGYAPNAEYIYDAYPFAIQQEINEALAYYRDYQSEIDRYIAGNEYDDFTAGGGA